MLLRAGFTEEEVGLMFEMYDVDMNRQIDFEEFSYLYSNLKERVVSLRTAEYVANRAEASGGARPSTAEIGKTLRDSRVELMRAANTARASGDEARSVLAAKAHAGRVGGGRVMSNARPSVSARLGAG